MAVLFLLIFSCLYLSSKGQCLSPLNDDLVNNTSDLTYLKTNGQIMLLPDLKFNCTSGYIRSIKIIAFLQPGPSTSHYVDVQIWRPTSNTLYRLIASDSINDQNVNSEESFSSSIKTYIKGYNSQKLFFQKGDIIGMYIPSTTQFGSPLFPTFLNADNSSDDKGSKMYWANTGFAPCTVSLCSPEFSLQRNIIFQTKIEVVSTNSLSQPNIVCENIPQLLDCPSTSTSSTTSTALSTYTPTSTISSSSTISIAPTNTNTGSSGLLGLPVPALIGIPIGATMLLIVLIVLLVVCIFCLKYKRKLWKGKTEEVHLTHYTAEDGTEYTHVTLSRKSSRASTLGETYLSEKSRARHEPLNCTTIDAGEEFDIATPLPVLNNGTPSFSIGSPVKCIEPYASLDCVHIENSIEYPPVERVRSATISGPVRPQRHTAGLPLSSKRSAPHFSVDNLDVVDEGRDEALPYIEAVGSMGNLQPPPLPPRSENDRKLSLPTHNPRVSSATTTRKPPQILQRLRVSSAKTRRASDDFPRKHVSHQRLQDNRKISQPARFPQQNSQQIPYERPISSKQQKRHPTIERSISLQTSGGSFPNTGHVAAPIDATMRPLPSLPDTTNVQVSPYMEPSPTNSKRFPKHASKFLEKSFSQDVMATPYTYPSPTKDRKFSEGVSPYLEPSPIPPKRNSKSTSTPTENNKSFSLSRNSKSLLDKLKDSPPPPPPPLADATTNNKHPNFIYIPPEEVSRSSREPHTGQVLTSQKAATNIVSPPLIDERLCVPDSTARKLLMEHTEFEIYSKLERSDGMRQDHQQPFWSPPSSATELYDTLSHYQYREINRNQISIGKCLGSGHFGNVHEGLWQFKGGQLPVAVKTLKPDAPEEQEVKFLKEAAITGQFNHPNIIQLHGIVSLGTPLMIILELLPKGDLKAYLKHQRKSVKNESANLDALMHSFISFSRDIASGMEFLAKKSFVHRDLAARNIFLTNNLTCKIGDFGMARDLAEEDYYESSGTKIPLKWTAPEAVDYRKYSTASDVWSYGMVLYEIWSLGHKPFQNYSNSKILNLIRNGYCQPPPPGCSRPMYQLMVLCWNPFNGARPSFTDIINYLSQPNEAFLQWENIEEKLLLGKGLEQGQSLYEDLQNSYKIAERSSFSLATTI